MLNPEDYQIKDSSEFIEAIKREYSEEEEF